MRWNPHDMHSVKYGVAGNGGYEQNFKVGHAIVTGLSLLMSGFYLKPSRVLDKVTLRQVVFRVLEFSSVTLPPELHIHISFICKHCNIILTFDSAVR